MLAEYSVEIREATTRYININCIDKSTSESFDFDGYTVQTWLSFGGKHQYVPTAIIESTVSYKIPADMSLGCRRGIAETRIYKNGDVYEVLRVNITVYRADKPDIEPNE